MLQHVDDVRDLVRVRGKGGSYLPPFLKLSHLIQVRRALPLALPLVELPAAS